MLAQFFCSDFFLLYGGIYVGLCIVLELYTKLEYYSTSTNREDPPDGCFSVIGLYMLFVIILAWIKFNFWIALSFVAIMVLCMALINMIFNIKWIFLSNKTWRCYNCQSIMKVIKEEKHGAGYWCEIRGVGEDTDVEAHTYEAEHYIVLQCPQCGRQRVVK